jgi:hypothetical protein
MLIESGEWRIESEEQYLWNFHFLFSVCHFLFSTFCHPNAGGTLAPIDLYFRCQTPCNPSLSSFAILRMTPYFR